MSRRSRPSELPEALDGPATAEASLDEIVRLIGLDARRTSGSSGEGVAIFTREGEHARVSSFHHGGVSTPLATVQHFLQIKQALPGALDVLNAPAAERTRAVSFHHRRVRPWDATTVAFREEYRQQGVRDEMRRFLYDGRRGLALVAAHRDLELPDFGVVDLDRMDAQAGVWRRSILRALARYEDFEGAVASLLFTEGGRLEHASVRARDWLTPARRNLVESTARAVGLGAAPMPEVWVGDGVVARFTRLTGAGPAQILATLSPTSPPLVDTTLDLTLRQRTVAAYAGAGARTEEIAGALGISAHTVRDHLKSTYRVLGIRSRAELARLLAEGLLD